MRAGSNPKVRAAPVNASYCVLRQDDATVFFDAGPYGASHQHQDKLNLIYSRGDRLGLIEYGVHTYEATIWRKPCLGSGGHNCLLVDGTGQWRTGAEQQPPYPAVDFAWRSDPSSSSVVGRYDEHLANLAGDGAGWHDGMPCITGVVHERAVPLLAGPGFAGCLLVEDRVRCRASRRLTLLWHLNSERILDQRADGLTAEVQAGLSPCAGRAINPADWLTPAAATARSASTSLRARRPAGATCCYTT